MPRIMTEENSTERKNKRSSKQSAKFFPSSSMRTKESGSSRPKSQQRRFRLPMKTEKTLRSTGMDSSPRVVHSMSPGPGSRTFHCVSDEPVESSTGIGRSPTGRKTAGMHFPVNGVRNIKDCISGSLFSGRTPLVCCSPRTPSPTVIQRGERTQEAAAHSATGICRDPMQRVHNSERNQEEWCNERRTTNGECSTFDRPLKSSYHQTSDVIPPVDEFSFSSTKVQQETEFNSHRNTTPPNQWGSLPEEAYVYRRYQYMEAEVEYLRDMELELRGRLRQSQSENSALSSELNRMKESWKDALVAKRKAEEAFADQTETISRLRIAYGRKVDEVRKLQLQLAEDRREWMASIQKLQNEVESQSKERRKKETNQSDTDSDISLNEFIGSCASPCSNYEPGILSSSRNNSPVVSPRTLHDLRAENKRLNEENKRLKADHDQVQKTQQAYDRRQKLDALKQEGNNHFQRGEYQEALNCYSQAINFAEDDPRMQAVLHSNKAAILINFEKNLDAIVSCCCAVSADSSYLRAFQRRANAYESLGDISAALQDLQWIINSDCESSSLYHEAQVKIMELQSRYKRSQKADPYKVLGLRVSAGTAEVKSQFRKLALQFHPDKTSNQEGSAEVFKLISQANSILSDEIKRRRFDSVRLNSSRIDQTKRV